MSHPEYTPKTVRDWARFQQYYDAFWQTIENGAVRMSTVRRALQQGTYYFGLRVPAGRRLIVYNRLLKLTEGFYTVDVVVPANGFTGGAIATKSRLNPKSAPTVLSNLYYNVTPSGALTLADEDFVDVGNQVGAGRVGGAPNIDNVVAVITGDSCLRVISEGADPYTAGIRLIAWEEDDPDA